MYWNSWQTVEWNVFNKILLRILTKKSLQVQYLTLYIIGWIKINLFSDVYLSGLCKTTFLGWEYLGTTVNTTVSGAPCTQWTCFKYYDNFTDGNALSAKNYCRNPDRWSGGPWCYTSCPPLNLTWEYCNAPFCRKC